MTRMGEPWNHLEAPSLTCLAPGLGWLKAELNWESRLGVLLFVASQYDFKHHGSWILRGNVSGTSVRAFVCVAACIDVYTCARVYILLLDIWLEVKLLDDRVCKCFF